MERINSNSVDNILDICLASIDIFSSIAKDDRKIFLHVVCEVSWNLNKIEIKKHKCALCGGSGHNFDNYPKVLQNDLKSTYICLHLSINELMAGLHKLYPMSKNHNAIQSISISDINFALTYNISTDGLQGLQAVMLCTIQMLEQQQKSINSLEQTIFDLHNMVVTGFDQCLQSDTNFTATVHSY